VAAAFGIGFFGLIVLFIGWFEKRQGVAGPMTDLGHGALAGLIITVGLLAQLHAPERKIAGVQQAVMALITLVIISLIGADFDDDLVLEPIFLAAVGLIVVLHPAREEFFQRGAGMSRALLTIAALGAIPLIAYAVSMVMQAGVVVGPPHYADRLRVMATMAIAILLTALLAACRTHGWRISAWSAGMASVVFGLASILFPDDPGSAGRGWGVLAVAGGFLFIVLAEREAR